MTRAVILSRARLATNALTSKTIARTVAVHETMKQFAPPSHSKAELQPLRQLPSPPFLSILAPKYETKS